MLNSAKKSKKPFYYPPSPGKNDAGSPGVHRADQKEYPDATHCCSAVKIGALTHSSDDGEPAGTAGRPMLDVLRNSEADEICAVVIRYFGGTL
ncbi:YigZ family protein [Allobaculum sp. Allo2]|uniref:YigZ family protein n=1 Tax=Allobaculum sp. Allo2 TaxID=2853432 RepID=UPI003461B8BC|nr:YigZ family protein [Allobaculum sp. Allo2]